MAASVFASWTGPRTTGRLTVVASVRSPDPGRTAASAVGPSSQGLRKSRWSFAQRWLYPKATAARAQSCSRRSEKPAPRSTSGRWTPYSRVRASVADGFSGGVFQAVV